jgi:hypothetical protein
MLRVGGGIRLLAPFDDETGKPLQRRRLVTESLEML